MYLRHQPNDAVGFRDSEHLCRLCPIMKFVIRRDSLVKPLAQVSGVVERRQTLPILSNVLIRCDDQGVSLTGTDLEVELVGRVSGVAGVGGQVTVPARKFLDIVRELPEGTDVELELTEDRLTVRCGRFRSVLSTLPALEFPSVDRSSHDFSVEVSAPGLKRLLDRTGFAMAQQDVRHFLNGMLIEFGSDYLRAVATDGHRLAMSQLRDVEGLSERRQVILPRKGIVELQRLLSDLDGSVKMNVGTNHLGVETDDFSMTTKLIDGRFPDYDRVIPKDGDKVVVGDKLELRRALSRTGILSNEKFRGIRVSVGRGVLTLLAHNPEQEEAEESLAVDYDGADVEVGFNVGYLQDVLNAMDAERVRLTLRDGDSSALIESAEDESSVYVVMPMKL